MLGSPIWPSALAATSATPGSRLDVEEASDGLVAPGLTEDDGERHGLDLAPVVRGRQPRDERWVGEPVRNASARFLSFAVPRASWTR